MIKPKSRDEVSVLGRPELGPLFWYWFLHSFKPIAKYMTLCLNLLWSGYKWDLRLSNEVISLSLRIRPVRLIETKHVSYAEHGHAQRASHSLGWRTIYVDVLSVPRGRTVFLWNGFIVQALAALISLTIPRHWSLTQTAASGASSSSNFNDALVAAVPAMLP